jgi:hypothetical protein
MLLLFFTARCTSLWSCAVGVTWWIASCIGRLALLRRCFVYQDAAALLLQVHLIMELCSGGDLVERIMARHQCCAHHVQSGMLLMLLFFLFCDQVHLIMELCSGGDLVERIMAKGYYTEHDAAAAVRKMLEVRWCSCGNAAQ